MQWARNYYKRINDLLKEQNEWRIHAGFRDELSTHNTTKSKCKFIHYHNKICIEELPRSYCFCMIKAQNARPWKPHKESIPSEVGGRLPPYLQPSSSTQDVNKTSSGKLKSLLDLTSNQTSSRLAFADQIVLRENLCEWSSFSSSTEAVLASTRFQW